MKKVISVFYAFMAAVLFTTSALAGGSVKLSSPGFSLGSLIANGTLSGLGNTDWIIGLDANGHAAVVCINYGNNDVRGQSSPHVDGQGTQGLPADSQLRKNGKSVYSVTAKPLEEINPNISWEEGGCPNSNWSAKIDFVYWDGAILSVIDPITHITVATYAFTCTTTRIPQNDGYTFDDGTVSCTLLK